MILLIYWTLHMPVCFYIVIRKLKYVGGGYCASAKIDSPGHCLHTDKHTMNWRIQSFLNTHLQEYYWTKPPFWKVIQLYIYFFPCALWSNLSVHSEPYQWILQFTTNIWSMWCLMVWLVWMQLLRSSNTFCMAQLYYLRHYGAVMVRSVGKAPQLRDKSKLSGFGCWNLTAFLAAKEERNFGLRSLILLCIIFSN